MRIVSANLFCLNPTPRRAIEAVAAQQGDVVVLIEAHSRFDRFTSMLLPPRRGVGYTRARGLPVAIHAPHEAPMTDFREEGMGWLECRIGGVTLMAVHAIAPYLPWRWPRREKQLAAMARRMRLVREHQAGLVIGDFNTIDFEPAWERYTSAVAPWQWLDRHEQSRRGTWGLGGVWSPLALDHALATPILTLGEHAADNGDSLVSARSFVIPGSDHLGLVVDLPAHVDEIADLHALLRRQAG